MSRTRTILSIGGMLLLAPGCSPLEGPVVPGRGLANGPPEAAARSSVGPRPALAPFVEAPGGGGSPFATTATQKASSAGPAPVTQVIWEHRGSGERGSWLLNGSQWDGGYTPLIDRYVDPAWRIIVAADFTGDAEADLLWRHDRTGDIGIWPMTGGRWNGEYLPVASVPVEWQVAAAADFTGDGSADLVWQNTRTGERGLWPMSGTRRSGGYQLLYPAPVSPAWSIAAAADLSGDAAADVVWQNTATGERGVWVMNGATLVRYVPLYSALVPLEWRIAGAIDLTGEGSPELIWENERTGERGIWIMDHLVFTGEYRLLAPTSIPPTWRIAALLSRASAAPPVQAPDLDVQAFVGSTYVLGAQDQLISVVVHRRAGPLSGTQPVIARLHLSADAQLSANDPLIWQSSASSPYFAISQLNDTGLGMEQAHVDIPLVSPGAWHIIAVVDPGNVHAETDESNNAASYATAFTNPSLGAPTLLAPSGSGVSTTPTFSWTAVPGADRYWLMVARSESDFPSDPAATTCTGCVISGITSATSYTAPNAFPVQGRTATLTAATRFLWRVQAYSTSGVNGEFPPSTAFTTQASLPDLSVSLAQVPGAVTPLQTLQLPVTIRRTGGPVSSATRYALARIYLADRPSLSGAATLLWESNGSTPDFPAAALNAQGQVTVTATVRIPSPVNGAWYLVAQVDPPTASYPSGFEAESDESNNFAAYLVTITGTSTTFTWPTNPSYSGNGSNGPCGDWPGEPQGCYWLGTNGWRDVQPFQRFAFNGRYHLGADWNLGSGANDAGLPVYAAGDGVIESVQSGVSGWGNVIFVRHQASDGTYTSMYAHVDWMSAGAPAVGTRVNRGQQIARVGNGGGRYPYHLHFEIRSGTSVVVGPGYTDGRLTVGPQGQVDPNAFIASHR